MAQALNRLLRIAVVGGVEASVRLHIDRGDDINARDDRGLTPLMLAASRNKPGVCRLLIDSGADLFALDRSGRDALAIARALGAFDSAAAIEAALVERRATDDPAPRGVDTATLPGSVTVETKLGAPSRTVAPLSPDEATTVDGTDADPGAPDRFRHPPATLGHPAGQVAALPTVLTAHEPRLLTGSYVPISMGSDCADEFDTTVWEPEEETAPPPDDPSLIATLASVQRVIAAHEPLDDSEAWDSFEAYLPERATPLARAEDADSIAAIRRLFLRALREGSIPELDAEDVCSGPDGVPDAAALSLLRFVINDLGAEADERVEYRTPYESFEVFIKGDETAGEEDAIDEAMAFLADLESHRNDPVRLYMRDIQRRSLISAEEEVSLAKAMDSAAQRALDALAVWPAGMRRVLVAIKDARMAARALNSITAGSREEAEPDLGALAEGLDLESTLTPASTGDDLADSDDSEVASGDDPSPVIGSAATAEDVHRQVEDFIRKTKQRLVRGIDHERLIEELRALWEVDFIPTTETVAERMEDSEEPPKTVTWEEVLAKLPEVLADIDVRMINGKAKDALDYAAQGVKGLKVIAIGGDKLARGLTLEGLCTSYFVRTTKMYDTLMQMGRWFGYRPDYIDLCRLYTTEELVEWFGHIADASEELREEFDAMAESGATPRDYGLRVQSHPVLLVTSPLKMRTARNLQLSFSGEVLETVALHSDPTILAKNLEATDKLIAACGPKHVKDPKQLRAGVESPWNGHLWTGVASEAVAEFFESFATHPKARKVNSALLRDFVKSMAATGELTSWTVALLGGGSGGPHTFPGGIKIDAMTKRSADPEIEDRYAIGRLLSPRDEAIDLDDAAWQAALERTKNAWKPDAARQKDGVKPSPPEVPNGPSIRHVRGKGSDGVAPAPERGVLLLYPLDPKASGFKAFANRTEPVMAFGVSFPASDSGVKVEYAVDHLTWTQEYGPTD